MIACSKCGTSLADDLRFCTECGTPVIAPSEPQGSIPTIVSPRFMPAAARPTDPPRPAEVKSNRAVVIVLSVVVVILLLALGGLAMHFVLPSSGNKNGNSTPGKQAESSPSINAPSPGNTRATPTPTISRSSTPLPTQAPPPNTSPARQAVLDTLEAWAAAIRAHDLNTHMSYFADRVDPYYLEHDVSSTHIRASLQPAYDRYYRLDVQLSNIGVSIEPDGTKATVTFDKTYSFKGDKVMAGSVKEMIWLSMTTGRWRITGVRDLQVYYQNK